MIGVGVFAGQGVAAAAAEPTFRAWGTVTITSSTTATAAAPAGALSTDYLIHFSGGKPYDSYAGSIDSRYTSLGQFFASGTVAAATSSGSVGCGAGYRTGSTPDGAVTFNHSYTTVVLARQAAVYSNNGTPLSAPVAWGLKDTDASGTTVLATNTGTTPDIKAGDLLIIAAWADSVSSGHSSGSLSVPGCTVSAVTWEANVTASPNHAAVLMTGRATVTAGASTGWPVYSATCSFSGHSHTAAQLVRIR